MADTPASLLPPITAVSLVDADPFVVEDISAAGTERLRGLSVAEMKKLIASLERGGFRPLGVGSAVVGEFPGLAINTNGAANISFAVPADFGSIVELKLIASPDGFSNAAADIDLTSNYGALGEGVGANTETDITTTYNFGTADVFTEIDVSAVFTGISPNDFGTFEIDHNGVGGSIGYLFSKFIYLPA